MQWIVDTRTTAYLGVMANRIWLYHFGRGIVDTPNDFGKMGQPPSHPALLDYLADQLRQHQSLKQLHRQIVLSATYRQASTNNPAYAQIDRDNVYLWRQQRRKLSAENVRDAVLKVAGKLNPTLFGPSFQTSSSISRNTHSLPISSARCQRPAQSPPIDLSVPLSALSSNRFSAALDCGRSVTRGRETECKRFRLSKPFRCSTIGSCSRCRTELARLAQANSKTLEEQVAFAFRRGRPTRAIRRRTKHCYRSRP